jgi:2-polyprenyl-3-methyl-5-hydroxy-6-metoxy-1,4-benzoquinol methylase
MLAEMTGNSVLGTDICAPFIEQAKATYSLPNLKYQRLDFNDLSEIREVVKDHKLDYVVGDGILHHLYYNLDESLKNINSLLADNGKIIFLEPNFFNPYCLLIFHVGFFRKLAKLEPVEMTFTSGFMKEKLEVAGFSPVLTEYRDFLVPGTPESLMPLVVAAGAVMEKIPLLKLFSQSLFISADKKPY